MQILLLFYIFFGLFTAAISLPLIGEKVKPNLLYGFRVRATLENPAVWYATNKHFGKRLLLTSLGFLAGSVILFFIPGLSLDAYALGCMAIFLILFTVSFIQSLIYLRSQTRDKSK
jgi:hypothetical protein